jgi:anti-sigma factor RsiW
MGNKCREYAVDLSAYFDGELDAQASRSMETHLTSCADCRDTLDKFKALRGALTALSRPPGRTRSVLDELRRKLELDAHPPAGKPHLAC